MGIAKGAGAERPRLLAAGDQHHDAGRSERFGGESRGERDDYAAAGGVVVGAGNVGASDLALGEQPEARQQPTANGAGEPPDTAGDGREGLEQRLQEDETAARRDPRRHEADQARGEDQAAPRRVHVSDQADRPRGFAGGLDRRDDVPARPAREQCRQRRPAKRALGDQAGRGKPAQRRAQDGPRAGQQRRSCRGGEDQPERGGERRVAVETLRGGVDPRGREAIGQGGGSGLLPSPGRPPRADLLRELGDRRHRGVEVRRGGGVGRRHRPILRSDGPDSLRSSRSGVTGRHGSQRPASP